MDPHNTLKPGYLIITIFHFVFTQGWKLNILESVAATLAIGLSVDFTLHYGVAYSAAAFSTNSQQGKYNSGSQPLLRGPQELLKHSSRHPQKIKFYKHHKDKIVIFFPI